MLKTLLDEMLAARLAHALRGMGHDVAPFPNLWKGTKNGKLVRRMIDHGFECLITGDKNMSFQQSLVGGSVGVLVLPTPRYGGLVGLLPSISSTLTTLGPGMVHILANDGTVRVLTQNPSGS